VDLGKRTIEEMGLKQSATQQ